MAPVSEVIEYEGRPLPRPKFWTPRNYDRPTIGTRTALFSDIWLAAPFMPWQRMVADVAGEMDADGSPWYDLIVVTLQRQGGKTHYSFAKTMERCLARPGWRSWYTAQTGGDARDTFLKFDEVNLANTPLRKLVKTLRGNGHEMMRFVNGSQIRPHPPTEKALHGKQSDENDIDEAWAFDESQGRELMQAIAPTQLTRPRAQTNIWSAGGTAKSTWLAQLVADGRGGATSIDLSAAEDHEPSRIAYFEWGIPDDMDVGDLESIITYHPAFGHTMNLRSLVKLRNNMPNDNDFARAAGNRWTDIIDGAIDADDWKAQRYDRDIPDDAPVGYGVARAIDGSETALVAASQLEIGIVMEVLDVIPQAFGAADQIKEWLQGSPISCAPAGPSAGLYKSLVKAGVNVTPVTGVETSASVTDFLDGIEARQYWFRPSVHMDANVKVAGTRTVGDGGKAWARVAAGSSIACLEAASNAVTALGVKPVAPGRPEIFTGLKAS